MKKLILSISAIALLFLFSGCNETSKAPGAEAQKSEMSGNAKCGDAKKDVKKAQCGAGKCGEGQ